MFLQSVSFITHALKWCSACVILNKLWGEEMRYPRQRTTISTCVSKDLSTRTKVYINRLYTLCSFLVAVRFHPYHHHMRIVCPKICCFLLTSHSADNFKTWLLLVSNHIFLHVYLHKYMPVFLFSCSLQSGLCFSSSSFPKLTFDHRFFFLCS